MKNKNVYIEIFKKQTKKILVWQREYLEIVYNGMSLDIFSYLQIKKISNQIQLTFTLNLHVHILKVN